MKAALALSLLALTLSAVALVSQLIGSGSGAPPDVTPSLAAPDADLLARVEALHDRVGMLDLQRPAPRPTRLGDDAVTREEFEALRAQLLALTAGDELQPAADPQLAATLSDPVAFRAQVASTLSAIRKDETIEKLQESNARKAAALATQIMPKIDGWLELTPYQSEQLEQVLAAKYEREAALTDAWADGVDEAVLGEWKANDWTTFQAELSSILTPEQYEQGAPRLLGPDPNAQDEPAGK